MLYDAVEDPGALTADELRAAYEDELRSVVDDLGVTTVAEESGVDEETLAALLAGESVDLTLSEAAAVLAVADETRTADDVALEVRDHLLMGMTTAVLDVDTIASSVDLDFDGKEVQQALEGRMPMRLGELAALHQYIAERKR
jgi:hypothetical protein